jgi:hypothetical protein
MLAYLLPGILLLFALVSQPATAIDYGDFFDPQSANIIGYSGNAMEPFISADGRYLFFNSRHQPPDDMDLHYAEFIDELTFQYRGEIQGANSTELDGVATMDSAGRFYFVSLRNYQTTLSSLYMGLFNAGTLSAVEPVADLSLLQPGAINFDLEISHDGENLYFNDGMFSGGAVPDVANVVLATRNGDGFVRSPNSMEFLANVNTGELEYAPGISADQLELFFTRLVDDDPDNLVPEIYRATRNHRMEAFDTPKRISVITGFVEGPTLSADGRRLYYHKLISNVFVIQRVVRTIISADLTYLLPLLLE